MKNMNSHNKYSGKDHTFAICAYESSPYIEECINSLLKQTVKSRIIICTSTPGDYLHGISEKYGLPLFVNKKHYDSPSIARDWNYALSCAKTELVTLAHQDDIYNRTFLEETLSEINKGKQTIISFTDYYEIHGSKILTSDNFINLKIKRMLLAPMSKPIIQRSVLYRRFILSLSDPICCPSVTFAKSRLTKYPFSTRFMVALDWHAWSILAKKHGRFAYIPKPLIGHRMYSESTTIKMISDHHSRSHEDYEILKEYWPAPIAGLLCRLYSSSQKTRLTEFKRDNNELR